MDLQGLRDEIKALRLQEDIREIRLAADIFERRVAAFRMNYAVALVREAMGDYRRKANFNPGQPRVPAGQPEGGQWTQVGGGIGNTDNRVRVAGGIDPGQYGMSVQDFVSQNCKAGIYSVLPSQFLDLKIGEVIDIAKGGDAAARRCLKLITQQRFRKP